MRNWFYSVNDSDTRYEFCDSLSDTEYTAEECAEDFHDGHDGWENSWPLTIVLYESEDGPEVGRYLIEREATPQFSATEIPAEAPKTPDPL